MKGTYKVPGGKLIRVDFEVAEGRISSFSLTGDFFLYPETGVDSINSSLTGCPINSKKIEERVNRAIESNSLEIVGFSADDVAKAVVETNEKATAS